MKKTTDSGTSQPPYRRFPFQTAIFTAIAILFVVIVMLVTPPVARAIAGEQFGEFGDQYGAANTLFTGLAFAFFIATLLLQREQIKMQSDELRNQHWEMKLTREEMKLQRKETDDTQEIMNSQNALLRSQTRALHKQVFETAFFSHINAFNSMRSELFSVDIFSSMAHNINNECRGLKTACFHLDAPTDHPFRLAFKEFFRLNEPEWILILEKGPHEVPTGPMRTDFARVLSTFAYFRQYDGIVPRLSAYMKSYFGMLNYINSHFELDDPRASPEFADEQDEEAYRYAVIARNQLSPPEIRLIAAYCDHPAHKPAWRLAVKYDLYDDYPYVGNEDYYITTSDFVRYETPVKSSSMDKLRQML